MNKLRIIPLLLMINSSCFGQADQTMQFGNKGINHESIALEFMRSIEREDYENCYQLVSEEYRASLNFKDFDFRMSMLKNFAENEKFILFNTTYIGATSEVDLRKLSGETVTKNIMPEYDFTVESEVNNQRKHKSIWLRFENENSDKIQVINYSYHYNFRDRGVSNMRSNPFMIETYFLIKKDSEKCYLDIKGGDIENKNELIGVKHELLTETTIEVALKILDKPELRKYKILVVVGKDYEMTLPILKMIKNGGYDFRTYLVDDPKTVVTKYNLRNPFPLN